jgi:hypothetical protein
MIHVIYYSKLKMIKNKLLLILSSFLIMGCEKKYNDFGDIAVRPTLITTPTIQAEEDSLKLLYGSLDDQANAYWLESELVVHVFPFVWQSQQRSNHSVKPEEGVMITTQPFTNAWVDTINFKESSFPQVLLHTIDALGTQRLEIFELQDRTAVLLFNLSTRGEIAYEQNISNEQLTRIRVKTIQNGQLVQDFYQFNTSLQQFMLSHSERRQADNDTFINGRSSVRDIENFLKGPWVKQNEETEIIVAFMPDAKEILYAHNTTVEVYNWRSSSRSGNRINLEATNSQIAHISGNTAIQVIDLNTISLNMPASTFWSGEYSRMNLQEHLTNTLGPKPRVIQDVPFGGSFKTSSGEEFIFQNPFFTRTNLDSTQRSGRFSLFTINDQTILQLRYTNNYGHSNECENFSFTLNEQNDGARFLRSITLTEVKLFINEGFPLGTVALRLEQIMVAN